MVGLACCYAGIIGQFRPGTQPGPVAKAAGLMQGCRLIVLLTAS
jgi:hypothetical protein